MLNISRRHKRFITLPSASKWRSLYSNEYTAQRLPRQKADEFVSMKDYGAVIGLPDQMQMHDNIWIRMTQAVQLWLFDVLCLASGLSGSTARDEWRQYLDDGRCFTNGSGTDTHHDYIRGTNAAADDMYWEPLICAGNRVDVIGEAVSISKRYFGVQASYRHYPVRVLDPLKLPTPQEFLMDPCVCHVPTTIKPDGTHGVFPQFGGRAVYPLWAVGGKAWVWERLISNVG
jgi:hypothetical protein